MLPAPPRLPPPPPPPPDPRRPRPPPPLDPPEPDDAPPEEEASHGTSNPSSRGISLSDWLSVQMPAIGDGCCAPAERGRTMAAAASKEAIASVLFMRQLTVTRRPFANHEAHVKNPGSFASGQPGHRDSRLRLLHGKPRRRRPLRPSAI